MPQNGNQKIVANIIIWLVILFSFLNFSAWYFPFLQPDTAVGILMSPGYTLPGDLYLWGQSHHGSELSFLSNLLILTYLFPAALAYSVAQFTILACGFFSLSALLKSRTSKIILVVAWFLPTWYFNDLLIAAPGIAASLLAMGIYLLNRSLVNESRWFRLILLAGACFMFILAIWTADFIFIPLILLFLIALWRFSTVMGKDNLKVILRQQEIKYRMLLTGIMTLIGLGFIYFAKSKAIKIEGFEQNLFNFSMDGIAWTIKQTASGILNVLLFKSGNIFQSIQGWIIPMGTAVLLYLSFTRRRIRSYLRKQKWLLFFGLNFFISILLMPFFLQSSDFSPLIYLSFWAALLLFIESSGSAKRSIRRLILYCMVTPGALSAVVPLFFPHPLPSQRKVCSEFARLGKAGIIGSYKDSYVIASADPKKLHATPNDSDLIRNRQIVADVFKQPSLYLVRDNWMNTFPDTVKQFGQILLKSGDEFIMGGRSVCRYSRYIYCQDFNVNLMKHQGIVSKDENALSGESVKIDSTFDRTKHFVFGPFIPLNQGKIEVTFRLKSSDNLSTDKAAVLEVSAGYGKQILASQTIRWCDFQIKNHFETFSMIVEIPENYQGVEFRIMSLGRHDLYFD
ncbi:MAG: hypothetical protein ACM3N9_06835, partial [Syntrophothermus sp.]